MLLLVVVIVVVMTGMMTMVMVIFILCLCPLHNLALHITHVVYPLSKVTPLFRAGAAPFIEFLLLGAGDGERRSTALLQVGDLSALLLLAFPLLIFHC